VGSRISILSLPIGNEEDLTQRGLRVLRNSELLIGEEPSFLSSFLKKLGIQRTFHTFNEHSTEQDVSEILERISQSSTTCIVSDGGLPNLEDPGRTLVPAILDRAPSQGWKVEFLPGASSLDAGLALAGFPTRPFLFLGLLPRNPIERRRELSRYLSMGITLIILETPYRYKALVQDLVALLGKESPRRIFLGLNLTHPTEEFQFRGSGRDLLKILENLPKAPPILLVEGIQWT
jgi:16S rRNA (cytidine1402-2'-O)-methyltransferase